MNKLVLCKKLLKMVIIIGAAIIEVVLSTPMVEDEIS